MASLIHQHVAALSKHSGTSRATKQKYLQPLNVIFYRLKNINMQIASKHLNNHFRSLNSQCIALASGHPLFLSPVSSEIFNNSVYITLIHIFKYQANATIHIKNLRSIYNTSQYKSLVKPRLCFFLSLKAKTLLSWSLLPDFGEKIKTNYNNVFIYIATYLVDSNLMAHNQFLNNQTDSTCF